MGGVAGAWGEHGTAEEVGGKGGGGRFQALEL